MKSFSYTLQQLAGFCNAQFIGVSGDLLIHQLLIDSRKARSLQHQLFIAIKGLRNDGHLFIDELYTKGFTNFLISDKDFEISKYPKANFLVVEDSLVAFQQIAKSHRLQFTIPVIGITGSNGKTIVKEWLSSALQSKYTVCKSPKSYNSQVGVPLSVLGLNNDAEFGVFEAGISQINEMQNLQSIIQPNLGVFTNIGQAHSENFKSLKEKVQEKLKLFSNTQQVVYCKDHSTVHSVLTEEFNGQIYSWSKKYSDAFIFLKEVSVTQAESILTLVCAGQEKQYTIPFIDEASLENCLHIICVLSVLGFTQNEVQVNLSKLEPLAMRLELIEAKGNSLLINDAYSSDIDSLKIALDFLIQQSGNAKKIAILSDLDETGIDNAELFPQLMTLLDAYEIEQIIGIGKNFKSFEALFPKATCFDTADDFIENRDRFDFKEAAILLKGARRFQFEKIASLLEQKVHETVLEVNLNAISENFHFYKSQLRKDTKVMVMVKAFSYGNGSYEIAHHLEYHKADYLAVAYVDEGISLRKKGICTPIMVLNPDGSQFKQLIEHRLEPEIYSFRQLTALSQELKKANIKDFPIHLKIDTGMRRLGFERNEIQEVLTWVLNQKEIYFASIFSHLASTNDQGFTTIQIESFTAICDEISSVITRPFLKHILNSSGILNFPEAQFNMVRLGIGLYGIGAGNLLNCSSLKSVISQIKEVPAGQSIGYDRSYYAEEKIRIAIIPIGYADGLSRGLSNGVGQVYINGSSAAIIGNVCMDMCMVDVSSISAQEGDQVVVWDSQEHIYKIADSLNTISYEVLTNVSQRVKRVFVQE